MRTIAIAMLAAALAGCAAQPVFDTSAITITYPQGYNEESRTNGASWEYWANHPTYILLGKDGHTIKMPSDAATKIELKDGIAVLK